MELRAPSATGRMRWSSSTVTLHAPSAAITAKKTCATAFVKAGTTKRPLSAVRPPSVAVEGFGCRPSAGGWAGLGSASEGLRGRKPRAAASLWGFRLGVLSLAAGSGAVGWPRRGVAAAERSRAPAQAGAGGLGGDGCDGRRRSAVGAGSWRAPAARKAGGAGAAHEVSTQSAASPRARAPPRLKVSTMRMRPPQQGQAGGRGVFVGCGRSARVRWRGVGRRRAIARTRSMSRRGRRGEQAVVADAVEAAGQDVQQEAAHELVGGSVMVL